MFNLPPPRHISTLPRKRPNSRITAIHVDCVVEIGSADKIRRPELGYQFRSPVICADRLELSGLSRCSARLGRSTCLDIDCLGRPYGLSGLLDRKIQYALVEMSVDGSILRLEWQGHRSVE